MDWKKQNLKREIEWAREDIKWSEDMEKKWRELLLRHLRGKHEGKWTEDCEQCRLWKEIITKEGKIRIQTKQKIRSILRGE